MGIENLSPKYSANYTPSASLISNCVGFHVGSAGTVTYEDSRGNVVVMVCPAGQQIAALIRKVTAFSGTAGTLTIFTES